ncbi:hypothetical protein HAX54_000342 [Datura stramonium]|uniref:Uncharacterized protein n=1 Tax=Datura stramonium TaxID=4076 RepID=A0ABS8T0X1_DATST|nr:hypothetical protein [Datura stramonium]
MTKNFLTGFVPLKVTKYDKIKKLERDLVRVAAIKKDCRVVENDLEPSRALIEFGVVGGDATTPNFGVSGGGGGYSPNVGGDFDGVDGGGGGEEFFPINEEVRCPPETSFTRGESSNAGVEDTVKILISKKSVKPSSNISDPYTPNVVKRRRRQISKTLTSAKRKAKNTPRVMTGDQTKKELVP